MNKIITYLFVFTVAIMSSSILAKKKGGAQGLDKQTIQSQKPQPAPDYTDPMRLGSYEPEAIMAEEDFLTQAPDYTDPSNFATKPETKMPQENFSIAQDYTSPENLSAVTR